MRDYDKFPKFETSNYTIVYGVPQEVEVAFIVTTYKREELLFRTVKSLINQKTSVKYQIIIADNDIEKKYTFNDMLKKYPEIFNDKVVYIVNDENVGGYISCHNAVSVAKAKDICLIHDDDVLNSNHLEENFRIYKENDLEFLSCGITTINPKKEKYNIDIEKININNVEIQKMKLKNIFKNNNYTVLGSIINKCRFIQVGGFENLKTAIEDWILSYKLFNVCRCGYYPIKTYGYYIYDNDSLKTSTWETILLNEYDFRLFLTDKHNVYSHFRGYIQLMIKIAYIKYGVIMPPIEVDLKTLCKKMRINYFISKFIINLLVIYLHIKKR